MTGEATVVSEKVLTTEALGRMPETATLRQISEELTLLAALREAAAEADAGRVVSHAEVSRRAAGWTLKSSGSSAP